LSASWRNVWRTTLAEDEPRPWRTLEYFALVRAMIASTLILSAMASRPLLDWHVSPAALSSVVYFGLAAAAAVLAVNVRKAFFAQVAAQITVDFLFISFLLVTSRGGVAAILYLLPLTGAALMLPAVAVFVVCSLAVFVLLAHAVSHVLQFDDTSEVVVQAGLTGAALFAVAALLRFMASRLSEQERLARTRGRMIEEQLEINRLVIAQMAQGAIVLDAETRVRANNRAARLLLGMKADAQLTGRSLTDFPALAELSAAFKHWAASTPRNPGHVGESVLATPALRLRARFVRPRTAESTEFAIFLEDERQIETRAQQLKLAAMGRLTASIAHEIRNPLGAIGHAAQLLIEDLEQPAARRLAQIVHDNTQRLNRLVEDVLRVARRDQPLGDDLDLSTFLTEWVVEFVRDRKLGSGVIQVVSASSLRVRFEESQLRQVLFNLMDNALRYASGAPGSVILMAERPVSDPQAEPMIWVFDDGPGVSNEMRPNLFEPFFTSEGRGTGLGLYMAREFCLLNHAELTYGIRSEAGAARRGFRIALGSKSSRQTDAQPLETVTDL
jgi:two-component system, NtrC family, sensor histidine kinase PilS